jgi:membrane protein YdbS with pleckstrin-like domain
MPVFEDNPDATRYKIPLHPNKIIKKTIESIIGIVFLAVMFSFFLIPFLIGFWEICLPALIILLVLLVIILYWYEGLYYKTYYYDIKEDSIIIRKGVWFKSQISFNYSKIQDVYIDQDPLDKIFGLYDVHLATAAVTSSPLAHIDGLDEENASKIRDLLLAKIKKYSTQKEGL